MGSGQSVPKDSSLACVLKNLKPLLLTELKANHLKQLSTDRWPEFGTFYFNILSDLSNFLKQNGKRSEVPYIQAFWDLKSCPSLYKDCSTYQILLCSLSPSITKEYKSKAPKRPPKPLAPNFDPTNEPPPYRPRKKASRDETLSSSPSSSKTESDDSKTPKEISTRRPSARI